jgi:hypothetical protein
LEMAFQSSRNRVCPLPIDARMCLWAAVTGFRDYGTDEAFKGADSFSRSTKINPVLNGGIAPAGAPPLFHLSGRAA